MHTLDYASTRKVGCGQAFEIILELKGQLNEEHFRTRLLNYSRHYSYLWGCVRRALNLAPYWEAAKETEAFGLEVAFRHVVDFPSAMNLLRSDLNRPFERHDPCLRVICVTVPNMTVLGWVFDHRLFDARGGELFMENFRKFWDTGIWQESHEGYSGSGLDHWRDKFEAGRKVNWARRMWWKSDDGVRRLGASPSLGENRFEVRHFDREETAAISHRAEVRAGPFMFLPYSLAVVLMAMSVMCVRRGQTAGDFMIAVTCNMRSGGDGKDLSLFNHLSFLYFKVSPQDLDNVEVLAGKLKRQLYEQVKNGVPEALAESSMLMRIMPRALLSWGFQFFPEVTMPTCAFACLGQNVLSQEQFAGLEVQNIFHLPRVPPSPGIGVFFSEWRSMLTMTISYLEGVVGESEVNELSASVAGCL